MCCFARRCFSRVSLQFCISCRKKSEHMRDGVPVSPHLLLTPAQRARIRQATEIHGNQVTWMRDYSLERLRGFPEFRLCNAGTMQGLRINDSMSSVFQFCSEKPMKPTTLCQLSCYSKSHERFAHLANVAWKFRKPCNVFLIRPWNPSRAQTYTLHKQGFFVDRHLFVGPRCYACGVFRVTTVGS